MTRKVTIPIYDGDDFERMSDLRRAVSIAERNVEEAEASTRQPASALRFGDADTSIADVVAAKGELKKARDAFDAAVDEAAERAEEWVLEPIGHEEYRELLADHPPREVDGEGDKKVTHPDDEGFEVNTRTFSKALLEYIDPEDDEIRTVVAPTFDTPAAFRRRLKRLAAGEFETLWMAAMQVNSGGITDPKLLRFSAAGPRSNET